MSIINAMETTEKRELHQTGDRELWFAAAENGSWSIPLFVEWRHDKANDIHYAHVLPAICLFYSQALVLNELFQPHDIRGRRDQWVIPRRICEAILHKAKGITPMYYYQWPTDVCPPIERHQLDVAVDTKAPNVAKPTWDSFVQWLAKERNISSSIITAVIRGIAEEAPTWMIEHRRPLDLGFCRLIAVPFRANWKEIVAFKCKFKKLPSLLRLPVGEVWKALEDIGFPEILTSPHNIALRHGWKRELDGARIDYTIEAIPSDTFEKTASRIEGQRMSRGGLSHIAEFEETVAALYKSLVLAMRSYCSKVSKPFAEIGHRRNKGNINLVPVRGRKIKVRETSLSQLPIHLLPNETGFSIFGNHSDALIVRAQAASVPKVPPVLEAADDMRERTIDGNLVLDDGKEGTDGLHVLHATQGEAAREPVLAGPADSRNGVDCTRDWDAMI